MLFTLGVTLATAASLRFIGVAASTLNRRDDVRAVFTKSQWSSATTISFPGSDSFIAKTERWNAFDPPTYAVAVSPGSENDLVKVVKLATANSIPFLATGGRHGYTTTLGDLNNGLAIDLSNFNTVKVNKAAATLTIGGSVRFRDIYDPVFEAGFEIQMGTCSCPGMVGVTLGGGIGPWGGVHGLLIDALLSLRVVTASGRVVDVSATSNPDLFWAFRGAGANFGIVVSATYRLQKQVNKGQIIVADMLFPAEKNASYFNLLETYNGKVPEGLSISSFVLYNDTIGQAQVAASWAYIGPEDKGRKAFEPVFALKPISTNIQTFPWNKVITSGSGGIDAFICQPGLKHNIYEVSARKLASATYKSAFKKISDFYKNNPTARSSDILISIYANQAALAVPDSATAYAYRDAVAYNDIQFSWSGSNSTLEAITTALGRQLRSEFAATSGYPDLAVYLNSAHGDETLEQKYGARKLPRLAALKKTWDPDRVFKYNNALPTKYP